MKIENIPANIKCKSLLDAREEINDILLKLENKNLDFNSIEQEYKKLIILNKHIEYLFKEKSREISNIQKTKFDDKK